MRDIENDGMEQDNRIAQALWEVVPDAALNDLQFEWLARRIHAAGGHRLQRVRAARQTVRMQWVSSVISAGLAASAVLTLVLMHSTPEQGTGSFGETVSAAAVSGTADRVREDRRELFAASVGEISEDEFLENVGGSVDAETLLASGRE